jgi:S-DNA-T family DNA segregation ATPase FtsK/SpoIIIE
MKKNELHQFLNMQADRVEQILRDNQVIARIGSGVVGARHAVFRLEVAGHDVNLLTRLRKLEEILALRLSQPDVQIRREDGVIRLFLSLPGKPRPILLESCRHFLRPNTLLLGLRADQPDCPLALRPDRDNVVHLLVTGRTGSGKTKLMQTMLASLALSFAADRARLVVIDPKGIEFADVERLPHVSEVIRSDPAASAILLEELVGEMKQRDRLRVHRPNLYVFIDELADLLDSGGHAIAGPLTRLTERGRGAGIHVIAGTQKPLASAIGSRVKANFGVRIVGAVNTAEDAKTASGIPQSGAEKLLGKGDFMLFVGSDPQIRFQAVMVRNFSRLMREIGGAAAEAGQPGETEKARRQWVYEDRPAPASALKTLPFPAFLKKKDNRGGHNRQDFSPEQIAAAQAGASQHQLKQLFGMSGSSAQRLAREYGPPQEKAQ